MESFRKSTRGFIELTAVLHLPLALAYVARLRELEAAALGIKIAAEIMAAAEAKTNEILAKTQ